MKAMGPGICQCFKLSPQLGVDGFYTIQPGETIPGLRPGNAQEPRQHPEDVKER